MAALSQVVNLSVNHDSAADDGVFAGEGDHGISDVKLGAASLSSHVPEITHVSLSLSVLWSSMFTLERIEVRPGTGAAVGVVSELVNMEPMETIREAGYLSSNLDWTRSLLLEVNCSTDFTSSLQNTHSLYHRGS